MKVYSPSDIAGLLGVSVTTLRKYSILLENAGHKFQRNNRNQRWYTDNDVILFRKLVSLKNNSDMKLKDCAVNVVQWSLSNNETPTQSVSHSDIERHDIEELKEMIKTLIDKVDYLENKLIKDDSVQQVEEVKEIEHKKPKKKSLFQRLFKN